MKSIRFIILILFFTHTSYLTHSQCSNLSVNAGTNANLVTETLYIISLVGLAVGLAIVASSKDVEGVHVYEIAGFPIPDQTAVLAPPKFMEVPKQRSAL